MPSEAGYDELRRLFDYLRSVGQIGPHLAGHPPGDTFGDEAKSNGSRIPSPSRLLPLPPLSLSSPPLPLSSPPSENHVPPHASPPNHHAGNYSGGVNICVVDADNLLDDPEGIIEAFCRAVSLPYDPAMPQWDSAPDQARARAAFAKWRGFHEDALESSALRPRLHVR